MAHAGLHKYSAILIRINSFNSKTGKRSVLSSEFPEHTYHALWLCSVAQAVWSDSSLWYLLSRYKGLTFMELWCWVSLYGKGDDWVTFQ